jgi:hypothetical protein
VAVEGGSAVAGSPVAPSISWTVWVSRGLVEQVEAAMPLLGVANHCLAVVAALRRLCRYARGREISAAVDAEYGPGAVVPAGAVTVGPGELLAVEDAPDVTGEDESRGCIPSR